MDFAGGWGYKRFYSTGPFKPSPVLSPPLFERVGRKKALLCRISCRTEDTRTKKLSWDFGVCVRNHLTGGGDKRIFPISLVSCIVAKALVYNRHHAVLSM